MALVASTNFKSGVSKRAIVASMAVPLGGVSAVEADSKGLADNGSSFLAINSERELTVNLSETWNENQAPRQLQISIKNYEVQAGLTTVADLKSNNHPKVLGVVKMQDGAVVASHGSYCGPNSSNLTTGSKFVVKDIMGWTKSAVIALTGERWVSPTDKVRDCKSRAHHGDSVAICSGNHNVEIRGHLPPTANVAAAMHGAGNTKVAIVGNFRRDFD